MVAIVGAVGVEVLPNVRNFSKELRAKLVPEADKLGQDLGASMGRNMRERLSAELKNLPNPKVSLDGKEIQGQINKLKAQLDALGNKKIEPKVTPKVATAEIDRLTMRLDELRRQTTTARVDVNDKAAVAKLASMRAALADIEGKVANPRIDVRGIAHADADLAALDAKLDAFGRKRETATVNVNTSGASANIDRVVSKINGSGGLMAGLLALAPAAVPVGAAITGAIGATLPVLTAAGAGLGAFGIAVAGSVKMIQSDMKSLASLNAKVVTAQNAVALATTAKQRTAAQNRLTLATQKYNAALKALGPAEGQVIKDFNTAKNAFATWDRAVGLPAISKVAHAGLPLFNTGLKIMTPLVKGTADALVTLEKGANKALNGAFGKRFIKFLADSAPKAIVGLGHAFAHIGKGIAGIILAFAPFQHSVLGALDSVTAKFATWGTNLGSSSGFHKFIQYVRENGPQLGKLLKTAGQAIITLVKAAASFGAGELKTMTSVLSSLVNFAKAHPNVAKMAVAVLALAKAVQVLKLASIGGGVLKSLALLSALKAGGIKGAAAQLAGKGAAAEAGSASKGAAAGASASALAPLAGAIGPLIAGAILHEVDMYLRKKDPTYGSVANRLDAKNPFGAGTGQNNVIAATFGHVFSSVLGLFFDKKKPAPKPLTPGGVSAATNPNPADTLPNKIAPYVPPGIVAPPTIPDKHVHITVLGAATAAQIFKALHAQVVNIPNKKQIKVASAGAAKAALEIINVVRAAKGLPPLKHLPVSAPGAKAAALDILNLNRRARGLPPLKRLPVSSPGAKNTVAEIQNLTRAAHGLPPVKRIPTSAPGAKLSSLQLINVARAARGLPPLKKIPTSTPGATGARLELINLLRAARGLPPLKHIPTNAPGATTATLQLINLDRKARGLPPLKKIPTSAPGIDKATLDFINLDRKARGLPPLKKIPTSAPGATVARAAIDALHRALGNIPSTKSVALKVIGSASDALSHFSFASGGHVQGPGGPRDDAILARLSNNEFVQPAHVVQSEGVHKMEALRKGRATIVPKYADGGLVINTSAPGVKGMPASIKGFLAAAASHIGKDQEKHLQKALASLGSSGGGGGADSWIPVVAQALALLHQPVSLAALWAHSVIANESGGSATAVNRTDINAQHGTPSVGGNQVIGPTFAAYAGPFRNVGPFIAGVSVNRLANTFAALNYAIHAYGSIANTPGIRSLASGGGYRPYATGGPVPGSGNGDTVPAMLTPGEFVLNKGAVSKVGMGILHAINGGGGTGDGFFHAGGPVLGIHYGAVGDWVKALAIQSRQLRGAFHQSKWDSRVSTDVAGHPPKARSALSRFDPIVGRLVSYLWGRHGKATTFDDALAHFNHGEHPMAFLDIMRAYDAGKGYLTEFKGKGKGRHRFIPDSTLSPFRSGLRRYEGMYHHDVQALEHKLHFKPENGTWSSGLDGPVAHVIDHALHKAHSQFLPRPWSPLNAGEKTLQQVLKSNADTAELNKDLNKFIKWGLFDLVENLSSGNQDASMLPTARAAAKNRGLATKLNAAYKVADRTTGINPLVNLGYSAVKYDQGGYIQPGHTMVINKTNKPEPVLSSDQWDTLKRGGSRPGINIEHVEVHDGSDVVAFGRTLAFTLANAGL